MEKLIIPKNYDPKLDIKETEIAIKLVKDYFEKQLAEELNLTRVSAPLFVRPETGMNDNLNGIERPVVFDVKGINNQEVEIVHSLAKWKRMALYRYEFGMGEGLYTDMNAIRRDEDLDNLHSIYVDQWDWEKIIDKRQRNEKNLKLIVEEIYDVFKTEKYVAGKYPIYEQLLPDKITFLSTQDLEDEYPEMSSKQRESVAAKKYGAVFIMKIGGLLKSGVPHDGRAPDYDDWELNGDIIFWDSILETGIELSSMGIRVDKSALEKQLKLTNTEDRKNFQFHKLLLEEKLPYTVGGGIGQSRICMFFLQRAHVGEVQAAIWKKDMIDRCRENKIYLL